MTYLIHNMYNIYNIYIYSLPSDYIYICMLYIYIYIYIQNCRTVCIYVRNDKSLKMFFRQIKCSMLTIKEYIIRAI